MSGGEQQADCAAGLKAVRAIGPIRTTFAPPRGGCGTVTRSISNGAHSFGITQQFTAQKPANTKLIRQLLAPAPIREPPSC